MRNKAPLALMEQTVMLLVFALSAALCLRAFAWADRISRENAARDEAVFRAQNAAQILKSCGGDYLAAANLGGGSWNGEMWHICYGSDWNETAGEVSYRLEVLPVTKRIEHLGEAAVRVCDAGGRELVKLNVSWQEVEPHAG